MNKAFGVEFQSFWKPSFNYFRRFIKPQLYIFLTTSKTIFNFYNKETWNKEKQQSETGCCTCSIS